VRGVFDISNHAKQVGFTAEPQLSYEANVAQWRFSASVGALLGNTKMNQHFYSVDTAYANASRPIYSANAGLMAWKAGISVSYAITPKFNAFAFTRMNTTAGTKNHSSPLVDKTAGLSYRLGFIYTFLQSETMVKP
jgi:MipA family protein